MGWMLDSMEVMHLSIELEVWEYNNDGEDEVDILV